MPSSGRNLTWECWTFTTKTFGLGILLTHCSIYTWLAKKKTCPFLLTYFSPIELRICGRGVLEYLRYYWLLPWLSRTHRQLEELARHNMILSTSSTSMHRFKLPSQINAILNMDEVLCCYKWMGGWMENWFNFYIAKNI